WLGDASFLSGAGSSLRNEGQFIVQTNCTFGLAQGYLQPGSFTNIGTILAPAGAGVVPLAVGCQLFNQGTLQADTDATLDILSGPSMAVLQDDTTFEGAGVIRF